jgi:plastocyanin
MNSKILVFLATIVLVIVLGGYFLSTLSSKTMQTQKPDTQNTTKETVKNKNIESVSVEVTEKGYQPAELKISAGSQVIWTNKSGTTVTVSSDNHPTHLLWPFLNLGSFSNDENVSVVFEKPGKYTYHNHFNPAQKGTVIVE